MTSMTRTAGAKKHLKNAPPATACTTGSEPTSSDILASDGHGGGNAKLMTQLEFSHGSHPDHAADSQQSQLVLTSADVSMSPPAKLIRIRQVLDLYGTQKSKFHDDVKHGLMTSPLKLSDRLALWPEYEVGAVNAARIAGQSTDEIKTLVAALQATRPDFCRFARPWVVSSTHAN